MEYCKHEYPIDGDGSPGDRCHECIFDDGRAEERAAIVRYLRVWADSVRDNEAIDGRLQALVTDTHAGNIESGEHITRPAYDALVREQDGGR